MPRIPARNTVPGLRPNRLGQAGSPACLRDSDEPMEPEEARVLARFFPERHPARFVFARSHRYL
jgi:hypothetical protein